MTTLVYQEGKVYSDSCITIMEPPPVMTYEEAYQISVASAVEVCGDDAEMREEYLKWVRVFFEHKYLNRKTLTLEYPSKIVPVPDETSEKVSTNGFGKLKHMAFCGAINMVPIAEHILGTVENIYQFAKEYNDVFVSSYNSACETMGDKADIAHCFTQIMLVSDGGCIVVTPSFEGPKFTSLPVSDKTHHICIGSGAVEYYHCGDNESYFENGFIYSGVIHSIDRFYRRVAEVDSMSDTRVVSV